jgi:riboflavin synthase
MFTGIVSSVGRVASIDREDDVFRLVVEAPVFSDPVEIGASVSFSGICLTITSYAESSGGARMTADLGPETMERTTAGAWLPGTVVNLERSLRIGDELGGHLVTGHIDATAEIVGRDDFGETVLFKFAAPSDLAKFIAAKGSVALDGTSLTVNHVDGHHFDCHLIPHTMAVTNWGDRRLGDRVNLEVDLIARYTARLLAEGRGES